MTATIAVAVAAVDTTRCGLWRTPALATRNELPPFLGPDSYMLLVLYIFTYLSCLRNINSGLCDVRLDNGPDYDSSQQERDTSGSDDDTAGGPDYDFKEHMRYFRHDTWWPSGKPCYCLEAIGWVSECLHIASLYTVYSFIP